VGTVREITYTSKGAQPKNVDRSDDELIVVPKSTFPDICVGCGKPAWGNTTERVFYDLGEWWWLLPSLLDMVAIGFRKQYLIDFPFCSSCPPASFHIRKLRLDDYLGVFSGAPKMLLDSLPLMPPDVNVEKNRRWLKRRFRRLLG
jgi:hypothetical protein